MKKILLIAINARYTHSCLALYCLKSFAAGLDYDIIIKEFSINRDIKEIIADIVAFKADAVAFSVFIWNADMVRKIIPAIKGEGDRVKIVAGGPEVSYNPDHWLLTCPQIDTIITGSGEAGFRHLLERGLELKEKIICISNPFFRELPIPYSDQDLAGLKNKYIYYESSRGCPHKCSYCLSSRRDQRLEMKDLSAVERELDIIMAHEPRLLKFIDRTFNVRKEHYRKIWEMLINKYGKGPAVFHFEIHPYYLDDGDFDILSACPENLFQFEIGVQSINQTVREAVGRTGVWETERSAIQRLADLKNIRLHLDLIAGLPFENIESFKRAVNDLIDLNPGHMQIGFLKVLPGTDLFVRASEYGIVYSESPPYAVIENRWLNREEVRALEHMAFLVDRLFNTGRFNLTLSCLARFYESPFGMYREMDSYKGIYGRHISRKWEAGAEFLLEFIASRHSQNKKFFLDTIRWDWCKNRLSHHYPDIIRPQGAVALKKAGCAYFRKLSLTDVIEFRGITFKSNELYRSIFFEAESEEFMREFMDNCRYALFLPNRKDIILYNLGEKY